MKQLSIVIITFNEERNIERCLKSVFDLSDDIVVVDSGSTDKTEEICKKYNVRFIYNEFLDYSSQKNFGNSLAKYDYILSIDADECISEELKESIININLENNNAYSFNRLNFHSGKPIHHGCWYPDKKIRIWNKKYGKWEGIVHETIKFDPPSRNIQLKGDLLHYTYLNKEEHKKQILKYSILNAQKDFEKGKKNSVFKIIFSPVFRFIICYIFKLGFLDGYLGFYIAKMNAYGSYKRKLELYKLRLKEK